MAWYDDKLEELKNSENISYDDVLYIIPFHLICRHNMFSDLKKVHVVSVETSGYNIRGCEVTGKVINYDKDAFPVEEFFSGHAIYRYKPGGGVITQDGIKWPIYDKEEECNILTDKTIVQLWCRFIASTGLYLEIPISKNMFFETSDDALSFGTKNTFSDCLLSIDRVECNINGYRAIFNEYAAVQNDILYLSKDGRRELWEHMIANENAIKENSFKMAFSKTFLLKRDCLVARKSTGEVIAKKNFSKLINKERI